MGSKKHDIPHCIPIPIILFTYPPIHLSSYSPIILFNYSIHLLSYSRPLFVAALTPASEMVLKLMGSYLVIAFTGFMLILLFLEKIGAKSDPEKPCLQVGGISILFDLSIISIFRVIYIFKVKSFSSNAFLDKYF